MAAVQASVQVSFEGIHVGSPELTEWGEPGIDLLQRRRFQAVEPALRVNGGLNEASLAQHAQVLGDCGLRHAEAALDLAHRLLGRNKQAEDGSAVRLRDDFEDGFHSMNIRQCVYACKGICAGDAVPAADW